MKKLLLTLGTLTAVSIPVVSVVSCGTHHDTKTTKQTEIKESYEKLFTKNHINYLAKNLGLNIINNEEGFNYMIQKIKEDAVSYNWQSGVEDRISDNLKLLPLLSKRYTKEKKPKIDLTKTYLWTIDRHNLVLFQIDSDDTIKVFAKDYVEQSEDLGGKNNLEVLQQAAEVLGFTSLNKYKEDAIEKMNKSGTAYQFKQNTNSIYLDTHNGNSIITDDYNAQLWRKDIANWNDLQRRARFQIKTLIYDEHYTADEFAKKLASDAYHY